MMFLGHSNRQKRQKMNYSGKISDKKIDRLNIKRQENNYGRGKEHGVQE